MIMSVILLAVLCNRLGMNTQQRAKTYTHTRTSESGTCLFFFFRDFMFLFHVSLYEAHQPGKKTNGEESTMRPMRFLPLLYGRGRRDRNSAVGPKEKTHIPDARSFFSPSRFLSLCFSFGRLSVDRVLLLFILYVAHSDQ